MNFEIVPIPGQAYEGRQWGWRILKDGRPFLDCFTGGTGSCWNLADAEPSPWEESGESLHVCDLDELIAALSVLRGSEAHRANVERWE
jgi:hypothetical protein